MKGGTILCFVILVNVCATLAATSKGDETGITKKYGSYEQRDIRQSRPPLQNDIFFKPSRINTLSQQPNTRVKPDIFHSHYVNGRRRSRPNSGYRRSSSSTFNYPQNRHKQGSVGGIKNKNFTDNNNTNSGRGYTNSKKVSSECSAMIRSPPPPDSGCCGIDITNRNHPPRVPNTWVNRRFLRDTSEDTVESKSYYSDRIAGGKATHFEQFPWTVLIRITFFNGLNHFGSSCGGSIISARFVLTAAHCIRAKNSTITDMKIYLSEFDKDTFPEDCEWVAGEGRRCIRNIEMDFDYSLVHPEYNVYDDFMNNDIALIRLGKDAPYTNFIRPICLPPFDIDHPEYTDFNLTVAGWGRNGSSTSQLKQSTVVNLIPQKECSKHFFPQLSKGHLCAAGRSGEDTCVGDSGGPIMMLYEGKYYVSGIISAKHPDFDCGTPSVPSMYTNVYRYLDWIKNSTFIT